MCPLLLSHGLALKPPSQVAHVYAGPMQCASQVPPEELCPYEDPLPPEEYDPNMMPTPPPSQLPLHSMATRWLPPARAQGTPCAALLRQPASAAPTPSLPHCGAHDSGAMHQQPTCQQGPPSSPAASSATAVLQLPQQPQQNTHHCRDALASPASIEGEQSRLQHLSQDAGGLAAAASEVCLPDEASVQQQPRKKRKGVRFAADA